MPSLRTLVAEPVVVAGILLSTAAMFALGFTSQGTAAYQVWLAIDVFCVAYFVVEALIEGWNDIPDAIAVNASDGWVVLARIYFGAAVLVGGILGLSLGNAVFVDQMMADNTDAVERDVASLTTEVRLLRDEIRALREILTGRPPAP